MFALALATWPATSNAAEFATVFDTFIESCSAPVLTPNEAFSSSDFEAMPNGQVSWSEDRLSVQFVEGEEADYTIFWYSQMPDGVTSTCSRSIAQTNIRPDEIRAYLHDLEGTAIVGGLHPFVYPSSNGFNQVDDTHTWLLLLPEWRDRHASLHVQIQSQLLTLTAFGGLNNSH